MRASAELDDERSRRSWRLPRRQRQAVVLRWRWQLSVQEAAEVMGVSAGSVKSHTPHGLRRLHEASAAA